MEIRLAIPGDAREIANVHIKAWQETYRGMMPQDFLDSLPKSFEKRSAMWERCAGDRDHHHILVAADDTGIVGFSHCTRPRLATMSDYGELTTIYLLDAAKGIGAGARLLRDAFAWLKTKGYRKAYCWVLEGNPAAKFYEKMGASLNGQAKHDEIGGQKIVELMYVWKSLN